MIALVKSKFRRIRRDERGSLSVEAVLVLPLLFWAIIATFTFFHAYKAQNATFRANYTISDILSRQTDEIGTDFLRGMHNVFQFMTLAKTDGTWIRVSVVQCKQDCETEDRVLDMVWSHGTNGARSMSNADFEHWESLVPWLPKGDSMIVVETSMQYKPPFENFLVSFPERALVSHSVTRPRFVPQLVWENSNNGNDSNAQTDDSTQWNASWGSSGWNSDGWKGGANGGR